MRIALDAMGGDHAPGPIVAGAVEAVRDQPDLTVVLVGDRERIEAELAKAPDAARDRLPIVHASQVIGMDEKPVEALRKKRDNSISKCWGLMAGGEVKAVVSAGNTGAMVASALFNAKMFLPGVRRPGIAAIFPSHQGPIVIIDVGANMNAKAEDLYQYGIMGAIYAETILGVTEPRIGLLNVGTEDEKGTELTQATRALFQDSPLARPVRRQRRGPRHLRGPRPGRRLRRVRRQRPAQGRRGGRRVPLLDAQAGAGAAACPSLPAEAGQTIAASLKELKTRFEYEEFGGGPLLGIRGACIICHGASGARAIKNALRVAGTHGRGPAQPADRRATRRRPELTTAAEPRLGEPGRDAATIQDASTSRSPAEAVSASRRCPRSPSCSPARVPRPSAWAASSTRSCPRPAHCSTAPARSSASTSEPLCFEGPAEALEATDVSQPAIFVASLAALESLKASEPERRRRLRRGGRAEPGRVHGAGLRRGARLRDRPEGRPPPRPGDAGRGRRPRPAA